MNCLYYNRWITDNKQRNARMFLITKISRGRVLNCHLRGRNQNERSMLKFLSYTELFWVGVGMHGPLIDSEDYPRSDIDVHLARISRHRVACLQTDHSHIMTQIQHKLHQLHSITRDRLVWLEVV